MDAAGIQVKDGIRIKDSKIVVAASPATACCCQVSGFHELLTCAGNFGTDIYVRAQDLVAEDPVILYEGNCYALGPLTQDPHEHVTFTEMANCNSVGCGSPWRQARKCEDDTLTNYYVLEEYLPAPFEDLVYVTANVTDSCLYFDPEDDAIEELPEGAIGLQFWTFQDACNASDCWCEACLFGQTPAGYTVSAGGIQLDFVTCFTECPPGAGTGDYLFLNTSTGVNGDFNLPNDGNGSGGRGCSFQSGATGTVRWLEDGCISNQAQAVQHGLELFDGGVAEYVIFVNSIMIVFVGTTAFDDCDETLVFNNDYTDYTCTGTFRQIGKLGTVTATPYY